jgi:hypothetical protein
MLQFHASDMHADAGSHERQAFSAGMVLVRPSVQTVVAPPLQNQLLPSPGWPLAPAIAQFQQAPMQPQEPLPAPSQRGPLSQQEAKLVAAVESLYADQLRPYGRILRKRLTEHGSLLEMYTSHLRSAVRSCRLLDFVADDKADWSVQMPGLAASFVDAHSPEDPYAPEIWRALGHYLDRLGNGDMAEPGGRYPCARLLMSRQLPFLATLSLGQVNHLVQLAISQKKLLGYLRGAVVPYRYSQSAQKERCAQQMRPSAGAAGQTKLATWEQLRSFLEQALAGGGGQAGLYLASFKEHFKISCRAELSETALGHAKVSELLQDPRVSDLCSVRLHRNGYAVFPRLAPLALNGEQGLGCASVDAAPRPAVRPRPKALCLDGTSPAEAVDGQLELPPTPELCFPPTPEPDTPQWASALSAPSDLPLPRLLGRVAAHTRAGQGPKESASSERDYFQLRS